MWYREYFSKDYWMFAQLEYSEERTIKESIYLQRILEEFAPGKRVVDLGCGIGRHSLRLAQAGFHVHGLDVSSWAINVARTRSREVGVDSRWDVVDLLQAHHWPIRDVDAAICIQSFGWGSDASQRTFLQQVRRNLSIDGILVLDISNLFWIMRNYVASGRVIVDNKTYSIERWFDPLTSRSRGNMRVSVPGLADRMTSHDIRIYTPAEAIARVNESGFSVIRVDGDFSYGTEVDIDTRYVQIVARPVQVPPKSLAVTSFPSPIDCNLDLRWTPDEVEFLEPKPEDIWTELLDSEPRSLAEKARNYAVEDPWGSNRASQVLSKYFHCELPAQHITFGGGVTSLLSHLAGLSNGGKVLVEETVHPDLPAWAASKGSQVLLMNDGSSLNEVVETITSKHPTLILIDRPSTMGQVISRPALVTLSDAATKVGATILVDESYASYLPTEESSVPLTLETDNLVVLRGLSKGYSWGGLRIGFAVASQGVSERVRELVPPMQFSELAYHMALGLLGVGDLFVSLRSQIRNNKLVLAEILRKCGLAIEFGHPLLPWIIIYDPNKSISDGFHKHGIQVKQVPVLQPSRVGMDRLLRIAVPLSEDRMRRCQELLKGVRL